MAMSVGGAGGEERPMSDINTTPLVDVMLVLLIIFLIAVPVAIQSIEKLKVPILVSEESQDKVENLMLSVVSTDAAGRSPKEPGYEGSSRTGQCRVYFNNITPVDNQELYQQAFNRLDAIIERARHIPQRSRQMANLVAPAREIGNFFSRAQSASHAISC